MDLERHGETSAPPQRVLRTLDRVNLPSVIQRHPALRWVAPLAVVGVAGVLAAGAFGAQARTESLPDTTPAALIAAVQKPHADGFSGTVVSHLSLGLPELPDLGGADSDSDATSLTSLLSGSHTLKVWYGGHDRQRVALLGATDETDLFRDGRQLWQWTSSNRTALHAVLPKHASGAPALPSIASPTATPGEIADDLMRELDASSTVVVHTRREVANRSAYELVLTPKVTTTKIGSVHIAVDGETKIPLGVQVYARGSRAPAIDVAYSSINFTMPARTFFDFTPPDGATVRTLDLQRRQSSAQSAESAESAAAARASGRVGMTTTGTGWDTVWTYRTGRSGLSIERGPLAQASTRVHGSWGAGRLVTSDLLTVLVTDDGRILVGAVDADALYAAAN